MVEAQGRGTLHCHMLIWLAGYLSPSDLKARLMYDDEFKEKTFRWLESIIKCELPGTTHIACDKNESVRRPVRGQVNPCLSGNQKIGINSFTDFKPECVKLESS